MNSIVKSFGVSGSSGGRSTRPGGAPMDHTSSSSLVGCPGTSLSRRGTMSLRNASSIPWSIGRSIAKNGWPKTSLTQ